MEDIMKMKQKGVATPVIIAAGVIVAVVAMSAIGLVFLLQGSTPVSPAVGVGGLPLYTGASRSATAGGLGGSNELMKKGVGEENAENVQNVPTACQSDVYTAPATTTSVTEVLNWYKTEMANQGWTKLYEKTYDDTYEGASVTYGVLYFQKGDNTAAVVVAEYQGEVYFSLVEGPEGTFDDWMDSAGAEWTPGGLTEYPDATECETTEGVGSSETFMEGVIGQGEEIPTSMDMDIQTYTTTDSVTEVLGYYRTEMASDGWTKVYDNTLDYSYMGTSMTVGVLYYEKADRAAAVAAVSYTYMGEQCTYVAIAEGPKTSFEQWMGGAGYEWEEGEIPSGGGIASATSLDFKMDMTYEVTTVTMRERARNIGTANMDLRVDMTVEGTDMAYIFSGSQQQGWIYMNGVWTSFSDYGIDFSTYWSQYSSTFSTYTGYLADWTSGEWSGTFAGYTYRIYDIQVDPVLDDSLFVH
jgi:hypothetical protein